MIGGGGKIMIIKKFMFGVKHKRNILYLKYDGIGK